MALAAWIGRRQRIGTSILALLSFVWLTVDRGWEGGIVVVVDARQGLTLPISSASRGSSLRACSSCARADGDRRTAVAVRG